VTEAIASAAEMPVSSNLYEIAHDDGTSYVVTGDEHAMHLVTLRFCGPDAQLATRASADGRTHTIFFKGVFDPRTGREHEYLARTYRAIEDNADSSCDSFGDEVTPPTLVRNTFAEIQEAMMALWEAEAASDPHSLAARAPKHGSLVDMPVKLLYDHPTWWQDNNSSTQLFRAVNQAKEAAVTAVVPGPGHIVQDSFSHAAKQHAAVESKSAHINPLLVLRDDAGHISYRPVVAGDVVNVVICLPTHPLEGACAATVDGSDADATFVHLEQLLIANHIPLNEAGGLVITEINPLVAGDNAAEKNDAASVADLWLVLQELGASKIISCGTQTNYRWKESVERVEGVENVLHDGCSTTFSFRSAGEKDAALLARDVQVLRAPHPCLGVTLNVVEEALQSIYQLPARQTTKIASIVKLPESEAARFCPFAVDGNARYTLANGVLTHNTRGYQSPEVVTDQLYGCEADIWSFGVVVYELLHGVRPWKDWTRLQQAGQAVQQQQQNGDKGAAAAAAGGAAAANGVGIDSPIAAGSPNPAGSPPPVNSPLANEEKTSDQASASAGASSAVRSMRSIHISSKLDAVTGDFLMRILCVDKKKRLGCGGGLPGPPIGVANPPHLIGWEEVKAHPWFRDMNWEKLARKELASPITPDLTRANCTADADLADQLLDRKPRDIPPEQQTHFRGWKFRTEVARPDPAAHNPHGSHHGNGHGKAVPAASANVSGPGASVRSAASANGVIVQEKQTSSQERKHNT
jgi:hypothetical protein